MKTKGVGEKEGSSQRDGGKERARLGSERERVVLIAETK